MVVSWSQRITWELPAARAAAYPRRTPQKVPEEPRTPGVKVMISAIKVTVNV
jgi:hypothetical protein